MKKIIVVSDTHGDNLSFIEAAIRIGKPDLIFHLGDYVSDAKKIIKVLGLDCIMVKGNGDYGKMDVKEDEFIEIEGKKIFLTHGHKYNVDFSLNTLYYKGLEFGADLILFGHTHRPIMKKENNIILMNPGSPSIPRKLDRKKTFGLITIGQDIKTEIIEIKK